MPTWLSEMNDLLPHTSENTLCLVPISIYCLSAVSVIFILSHWSPIYTALTVTAAFCFYDYISPVERRQVRRNVMYLITILTFAFLIQPSKITVCSHNSSTTYNEWSSFPTGAVNGVFSCHTTYINPPQTPILNCDPGIIAPDTELDIITSAREVLAKAEVVKFVKWAHKYLFRNGIFPNATASVPVTVDSRNVADRMGKSSDTGRDGTAESASKPNVVNGGIGGRSDTGRDGTAESASKPKSADVEDGKGIAGSQR